MSIATACDRCVVVYDGSCAFCRAGIERIRRRDRFGAFEFIPAQDPHLHERFPALLQSGLEAGMRLVLPDGTVRVGADAVHGIARRLPRWRWVAWLYRLPGIRFAVRMGYRWVAARRMRLGGCRDGDACRT